MVSTVSMPRGLSLVEQNCAVWVTPRFEAATEGRVGEGLVRQQPPHLAGQINHRVATGHQDNALFNPGLTSAWVSCHQHSVRGMSRALTRNKARACAPEGEGTRAPLLQGGRADLGHTAVTGRHADSRDNFHLDVLL